jgi:hypothetical protein
MFIDMGIAMVGAAIGPSTSPSNARAASKWRMVNKRFTGSESHVDGLLPRAGCSQWRQSLQIHSWLSLDI